MSVPMYVLCYFLIGYIIWALASYYNSKEKFLPQEFINTVVFFLWPLVIVLAIFWIVVINIHDLIWMPVKDKYNFEKVKNIFFPHRWLWIILDKYNEDGEDDGGR